MLLDMKGRMDTLSFRQTDHEDVEMTALHSAPALRRSSFLRLSPWLLVGLAVIFGLAIAVLAARNTQREKLHMSQNLSDRAGSLIWALEAGTRAWMGMRGSQNLQALLEETGKQPGITFMMVTDQTGLTPNQSDKAKFPIRSLVGCWAMSRTANGCIRCTISACGRS